MKNAAGDSQCDEYIRQELEEAGIEILEFPCQIPGEVPTTLGGSLCGWKFKRAWYYWIASAKPGVVLPFDLADELHIQHGQEVRVAGHCGCPAPREWYKEGWFCGVPSYHVDTQVGLNALAAAIRKAADA